jgi:hypothetical protein
MFLFTYHLPSQISGLQWNSFVTTPTTDLAMILNIIYIVTEVIIYLGYHF